MYLNEIWINSIFNGKLLVNVWCFGIKWGKIMEIVINYMCSY